MERWRQLRIHKLECQEYLAGNGGSPPTWGGLACVPLLGLSWSNLSSVMQSILGETFLFQ